MGPAKWNATRQKVEDTGEQLVVKTEYGETGRLIPHQLTDWEGMVKLDSGETKWYYRGHLTLA